MYILVVILFLYFAPGCLFDPDKEKFCEKVHECVDSRNKPVCGIRSDGAGFIFKIFADECELIKHGCRVENEADAYGIINMEYCEQARGLNNNNVPAQREKQSHRVKTNKCTEFNCDFPIDTRVVCGIRAFGPGFKVRPFSNECEMLKLNCLKNASFAITDIYVCDGMDLPREPGDLTKRKLNLTLIKPNLVDANDMVYPDEELLDENNNLLNDTIVKTNDAVETDSENIITTDIIYQATTVNELDDDHSDIESKSGFTSTNVEETTTETYQTTISEADSIITEELEEHDVNETEISTLETTHKSISEEVTENQALKSVLTKERNLVIVDATLFDINGNVNDTIDNFFASTHVFDLPIRQVPLSKLPVNTRRRIVNLFKPHRVFQPYVEIPENKSNDVWHEPTLQTCFHKCPMQCPDTYAPVCGVPGQVAREPSVMFKNHCFMDVAQCKMRWENNSTTAESSTYIESSFMICLGDTLNTVYRFLPLVRTLQHMGRLKKKGRYHYKMRNMRFFNELLPRNPNVMG